MAAKYDALTPDQVEAILVDRLRTLEAEHVSHTAVADELGADPHAGDDDKTQTARTLESLDARRKALAKKLDEHRKANPATS